MKKKVIIILISVIVIAGLIIGGLYFYKKNREEVRSKELEVAATKYYESHMSNIKGIDTAEITLKMINSAAKTNEEKYEISSLKNCKEDSKAILTISKDKVKNVEISLNCK